MNDAVIIIDDLTPSVIIQIDVDDLEENISIEVQECGFINGSPGGDEVDLHYTHDQPTPALIWNIPHNLGKFPSVTIVDTSGDEVEGQVTHIDINNILLKFSASFSGKAYLN